MTGIRKVLHDNGLGLVFGALFLLALGGQAISGLAQYNEDLTSHGAAAVPLGGYLTSSSFAVDVVENWQSEMLAVGSMAVFGVYLRQRGSPESKPVGVPHGETGETG